MHRARRDYRSFEAKKTGIGTGLTGRFPVNTGEIQGIYRDCALDCTPVVRHETGAWGGQRRTQVGLARPAHISPDLGQARDRRAIPTVDFLLPQGRAFSKKVSVKSSRVLLGGSRRRVGPRNAP